MPSEYTESYTRDHQHVTEFHWRTALSSQSASNVSGLVHTLSSTMHAIWRDARELGEGTDWVNRHPICFLMGVQISYLTGGEAIQPVSKYEEAVRICTVQINKFQDNSDNTPNPNT